MKFDEVSLQFFHAELNRLFFENQLEPAIIQVVPSIIDEETEAEFINCLDPFLICFYCDVSEEALSEYIITVLLHEMVHQYCYQNEIEDMTEADEHSEDFVTAAEEHGLIYDGYNLAPWAKKIIDERMNFYNIVSGIKKKG